MEAGRQGGGRGGGRGMLPHFVSIRIILLEVVEIEKKKVSI